MTDKNNNNPISSQASNRPVSKRSFDLQATQKKLATGDNSNSRNKSNYSEESEMKNFLMGLKHKLNNEESEESRNQTPRFAEPKKSVSNEVIFELDESEIKQITNA